MNIAANGHSAKKERKVANWLYISIGLAVVAAFVAIFAIEGRFANPFKAKAPDRTAADQLR